MKSVKVLGAVFIMMSGFLYSLERGFSMLATGTVEAGFLSGAMDGEVPEIEASGFFTNVYVPLFLIVGLILIIYGFIKK